MHMHSMEMKVSDYLLTFGTAAAVIGCTVVGKIPMFATVAEYCKARKNVVWSLPGWLMVIVEAMVLAAAAVVGAAFASRIHIMDGVGNEAMMTWEDSTAAFLLFVALLMYREWQWLYFVEKCYGWALLVIALTFVVKIGVIITVGIFHYWVEMWVMIGILIVTGYHVIDTYNWYSTYGDAPFSLLHLYKRIRTKKSGE